MDYWPGNLKRDGGKTEKGLLLMREQKLKMLFLPVLLDNSWLLCCAVFASGRIVVTEVVSGIPNKTINNSSLHSSRKA